MAEENYKENELGLKKPGWLITRSKYPSYHIRITCSEAFFRFRKWDVNGQKRVASCRDVDYHCWHPVFSMYGNTR